ncbi:MAG: histidine--tRNA ligase [Clostridia bacterium]|nr:histidine--tRNA ligase [Clostridia bacterium]
MLSKTPTKGMRDFLPNEYRMRQQLMSVIQSTYEKYGFSRIETPCVENIKLLCSKQGGDNEKLIFKILKRGEKLENATEGELCDLGLRYDLTVPLARYYANNQGQLPSVFKAMQMDNVWRADRPQKGRYRQFVQCDIDIVGDPTNLAEMELITATTEALSNLGFDNVVVRLSDRRLLKALVEKCGFEPSQYDSVFIALDKLDKLGVRGVMEEIEQIAPGKSVEFIDMINRITGSSDSFEACVVELGEFLPQEVATNVREILDVTNHTVKNGKVVFDVTLVRGMGYYTGTIYEISLDGLAISAGGGGRYDKMIGKIIGNDVPACGFSIGFERIVMLLQERGIFGNQTSATAVVIDKNADAKQVKEVMDSCAFLRNNGRVVLVRRIKNFAFQLKQLQEQGCDKILEFKDGKLNQVNLNK